MSEKLTTSFGFALVIAVTIAVTGTSAEETGSVVVLNDDGAWCWFQDERAVVVDDRLIVGSVANGTHDASRKGDIDVTVLDIESRRIQRRELFDQLDADDHNVPALWVRPDDRVLAVFAKHGPEDRFYYRVADSIDAADWNPVKTFSPSASSRITYSNLLFLSAENGGRGRLYNFYRGLDASFKPSFAFSDDLGETWHNGNVVINVPSQFKHRPYVKYATNGRDTIHLLYTDGHPRNFDNSLYHVSYRDGKLHQSNGAAIHRLSEGLRHPGEGTCVYQGNSERVAWGERRAPFRRRTSPRRVFRSKRFSRAAIRSGRRGSRSPLPFCELGRQPVECQ